MSHSYLTSLIFVSVPTQLAEMAALLYLSEYTHARHLWRRYETAATSATASDNPELRQLQLLWTAARPMSTHDHAASYAALDSCIASAMQPLATYAGEIRTKYRSIVLTKTIEGGYVKISKEACKTMLGYTAEQEGEMMSALIQGRGWTESGEYLIPCQDEEEKDGDEVGDVEDDAAIGAHSDRIKELADMVGFMEKSKLNL